MNAALFLDIDGQPYLVDVLYPSSAMYVEWQLTRIKPGGYETDLNRQYECSWEAYPDLKLATADGCHCTCPDFARRHAGTGSAGCKHIQALKAVRLIEPGPVSAAPDSIDFGDSIPAESPAYEYDPGRGEFIPHESLFVARRMGRETA